MHASVGRRRGFEPCTEVTHVVVNDSALTNDHTVLLQGRDKSNIYPAGFSTKSRPIEGGGIGNSSGYNNSRTVSESCVKRNGYPQTQKKDITVQMSAEASIFSDDEYIGKDSFYCDWPELDTLGDFETNLRNLGSTFEIGSNYFEDPICSSIWSPDAQLVPTSSCLFDNSNLLTVPNERTTNAILKSSVSVPDTSSTESVFLDQINMANPIEPSRNEGRETPLNSEAHACSSSRKIEDFSQNSDADFFCPFDNVTNTTHISSCEGLEAIVCSNQGTLVPTSSSIICNDEIVSSSTCSGPDLVAAYVPRSTKKSHDPLNGTPDMILDGMAENPLQICFPPLTTYGQPELLLNDNSTQMHQFPEDFGGDDGMNSAGLRFCSKGRTSAELCENPCSPLILEAVPVKDLGFQKLQDGVNQLDVATKTCIRDALYRLANCVEQRHCVASTTDSVNQLITGPVESSGSKRFKSNRWTEIQTNAMDRSVAELLLRKPLNQKTGLAHLPCQANHLT